jgi:hypothetical protein
MRRDVEMGTGTMVDTKLLYVRYEVFTVMTMKNAAFLDIEIQFLPHRKHVRSMLQR